MFLCKFGCGKEGVTQLKSGMWICGVNVSQCAVSKQKTSSKAKGASWTGSNKAAITDTSELCFYGCGKVAKFRFKNGRYCCSETIKGCIAHRAKVSKSVEKKIVSTPSQEFQERSRKGWKHKARRPKKVPLTPEQVREHMRELALKRDNRGGRGIKGYYKGIWCDSSWELAWVLFALDHGIPFTRNTDIFPYIHENKAFAYKPDYKVFDCWIEVKGLKSAKWQSKQDCFPYPDKLVVLYYKDLKFIFDYVRNKYGKDYVLLYDNFTYSSKKCQFCGKAFFDVRNGSKKFCNQNCWHLSMKGISTTTPRSCPVCKSLFVARKGTETCGRKCGAKLASDRYKQHSKYRGP